METPCHKKSYYVLTIDPVHVGTGGCRLGRVDNTIVREPGTNLPKIPGSSLCGVTRAYTALAIQNDNSTAVEPDHTIDYARYSNWKYRRPLYSFELEDGGIKIVNGKAKINTNEAKLLFKDGKEVYHSCAGKGVDDGEGHCGLPACPVCVAFGFSKGTSKSSFQGLAQFFDTRILFFPVRSMAGPIWLTSPAVLESAGIRPSMDNKAADWLLLNNQLTEMTAGKLVESVFIASSQLRGKISQGHLNLGWLYLPEKNVKLNSSVILMPTEWLAPDTDDKTTNLSALGIGQQILEHLVIVSDRLFSRIINDNLEVRTSVAIDPATGAGEDGALFTYEAIPRATVMWFDIVYNKPEYFDIKVLAAAGGDAKMEPIKHGKPNGQGWTWLCGHVEKGLSLLEMMGIGGMGTRGMGRLRILNNLETDQ